MNVEVVFVYIIDYQKINISLVKYVFYFVNNSHYLCPTCQRPFLSKDERDTHMKCHKKSKKAICKHCLKSYSNIENKLLQSNNELS